MNLESRAYLPSAVKWVGGVLSSFCFYYVLLPAELSIYFPIFGIISNFYKKNKILYHAHAMKYSKFVLICMPNSKLFHFLLSDLFVLIIEQKNLYCIALVSEPTRKGRVSRKGNLGKKGNKNWHA